MKNFVSLAFLISCLYVPFLSHSSHAQSVQVGAGSYSTVLPPGAVGPQPILPKISNNFTQPIQSNEFWSSLIFPFFSDPYSAPLYAQPLLMRASNNGLRVGYNPDLVLAGNDYLNIHTHSFTVSIDGLNASRATTDSYSDWMVTAEWDDGTRNLKASFGHGNPFIFFDISGGNAAIYPVATPQIWYQQGEVLGVTINGIHYGIFAPSGSTWTIAGALFSSLNSKSYLSVAVLPDNSVETLEYFRKHAYAFVTNSEVSWTYDESTAMVQSTYSYTTELKEAVNNNVNETLTALYSHQWRHVNESLTDYTYSSTRGLMKLHEGNQFSTSLRFSGILPSLPDEGAYDRRRLLRFIRQVANTPISYNNTYDDGKAMGRLANVVPIAEQFDATPEVQELIEKLKTKLEEWFTVGGSQEYYYNSEWTTLTGYPSANGADNQINDHHFHHAYAIGAAATIARYDSAWASQENWGAMVNLLIEDASNWDRTNTMFPFLRNFDIYAGHSWASGHAAFGDGNNQESSSESMNYATALILWGEFTNQKDIRDLGIFLYATEATAIHDYWFDVYNETFPNNYPHNALGILWGGKGAYTTWFAPDPEFIHGINFLPLTAGSFYLGQYPEYIQENYNKVVAERGGQPTVWKDIFWQYLAMSDPDQAMDYYLADQGYSAFDGESKAKTMHWIYNFKALGSLDFTVHANTPLYTVFQNDEFKTYIAFNSDKEEKEITFSDGFSMTVNPGELKSMRSSLVSLEDETMLPNDIELLQNYPNPFNPTTTISYRMQQGGNISLKVFNARGQLVQILVDEFKQSGNHSIAFNASSLPSGLYFYQLNFEGKSISKKMILMK